MRTNERGDTLLELVIAIAIMGIVLVAFAGGLIAVTVMSDIHRKQASAGAYLRNYAEAMENWVAADNYPGCASLAAYAAAPVPAIPSGYNKSVEVDPNCPYGSDIARLTLKVSSTDNRASEQLVIFVRKPCPETPC